MFFDQILKTLLSVLSFMSIWFACTVLYTWIFVFASMRAQIHSFQVATPSLAFVERRLGAGIAPGGKRTEQKMSRMFGACEIDAR